MCSFVSVCATVPPLPCYLFLFFGIRDLHVLVTLFAYVVHLDRVLEFIVQFTAVIMLAPQ